MQTDSQKKIKTAIITGASSGIGASLAHEFGKDHYNLLLVARDHARLAEIQKECEEKYQVKVWTLSCNLSDVSASIIAIKQLIEKENLQIEALVNNAGFGVHGEFSSTNLDEELNLIQIQTNSVASLTKMVLPSMLENKKGMILNVGSVYSYFPVPYQSIYGACKSFLLSFTLSLAHELKGSGIKISIVCPGTTQTRFRMRHDQSKMQINPEKFLKGMSAEKVAQIAYNHAKNGKLISVPGKSNKFFVMMSTLLPNQIFSQLTSYVNSKRGVNQNPWNKS